MPHELEQLEAASPDAGFTAALGSVSAEVLETMFFTEALAVECEHGWVAGAASVLVNFDGSHSGQMWLALTPDAVPPIASAFLGLEAAETSKEQRSQVICELANILCGAVLSSLWPESRLLLDAPQLIAPECGGQGVWHCCLALEEGAIAIWIRLSGVPETS